jgi:Domain of unknown function (DUF4190)
VSQPVPPPGMPGPPAVPPGPPGPPPAYYRAPTNGMAITSLVLGILGMVGIIWIISPILALVFGYIAKGQIDRSGGTQEGRGMAIAGIVLGWVGIAVGIAMIAWIWWFFAHASEFVDAFPETFPSISPFPQ